MCASWSIPNLGLLLIDIVASYMAVASDESGGRRRRRERAAAGERALGCMIRP